MAFFRMLFLFVMVGYFLIAILITYNLLTLSYCLGFCFVLFSVPYALEKKKMCTLLQVGKIVSIIVN